MCGIAGVVGDTSPRAGQDAVRRMVAALAHRGPDSEGIETWHGAILGHRRLAIFDLTSAGHQPMLSPDRSLGVVFNGAIYNHRDLRRVLTKSGYTFRSQSDTEVLIHGYQEWGIDELVSRLRGMFAFGLWDNRSRRLYLVRDRLGVKPLVFIASSKELAFASTVRALRVARRATELDERGVADFLRYGFVRDDLSIYRGCVKVPSASIVEWSDGTFTTRQYWKPHAAMESPACSFDEAVEETERLLLSAVETRLHADVPVGALLSGGVDSSLICWAASRLGADITAYTVGTPGDPWDETTAARQTAKLLGIRHRVLEMRPEDDPSIADLASAYAEPFASASALGMLKVSQAVASSAKVLLTGDGGDDVFLGYPRHRNLWVAGIVSTALPSVARRGWLTGRSIVPRVGPLRRAAALFDYATGDLHGCGGDIDLLVYRSQGLLGDRLSTLPIEPLPAIHTPHSRHELLARHLTYEYATRFVGEYMTKVDGATMHFGLEARSPFLDQYLWEFASSLPFDVRLHRGRLKAILRALAHRRIGPVVARGKKRGFGIPVQRWIMGRWGRWVHDSLLDSIVETDGWIRAERARAQLRAQGREAPVHLWYIFVLESWLRQERALSG
jgi:asparagine synthase (glutamine-hydrolysing)